MTIKKQYIIYNEISTLPKHANNIELNKLSSML